MAGGGLEAWEILATRRDFDLIVCDLVMPDLTGMELYRRARDSYPELEGRFVFVTGGSAQDDVRTFLRTVGNQVMEKPFDVGALQELIAVRTAR
jgi:CheY-like chemotaxis protein